MKDMEKNTMNDVSQRDKEGMKILFISPHLSTVGLLQYILKKIESLIIEHVNHCDKFTVQKLTIKNVLGISNEY